MKEEDL